MATLANSDGNVETFDLSFKSSTYLVSTSSVIEGACSFNDGRNIAAELSFDADGAITGGDSAGCAYSGTVTIPDAKVNTYEVAPMVAA